MYSTIFYNRTHKPLSRPGGLILCLVLCLGLCLPILAAYPTHNDFVSDADEILSANTEATIISTNETLYREKEVKIAVCLTSSTGGKDLATFSRSLFTEWKMCDGVLLVLDTKAQSYFAVQSVAVDDILTNSVLSEILTTYLEPDFSLGNIEQGVSKTVIALAQYMHEHLPDAKGAAAPSASTGSTAEPEADKPSAFITVCKVILWVIVIAAILAVVLFIIALFNDDMADLLRTYVFRRGNPAPSSYEYYDDRLYGSRQNQAGNNRRPAGQNPRQNNRPHPQNRNDLYNPYDDYAMQYRQSAPRNGQPRQNPAGNPNYSQRPASARPNPNNNRRPASRPNDSDRYGY